MVLGIVVARLARVLNIRFLSRLLEVRWLVLCMLVVATLLIVYRFGWDVVLSRFVVILFMW